MDRLLIVNYHYIRNSFPQRGISGVTPELFENQLKMLLKEGYSFIAISELHSIIKTRNTSNFPKKICLITFDDGLAESFDNGLTILDSMGIPAIFYISTAVLSRSKVHSVHKFHWIQSKLEVEDVNSAIPGEYLKKIENIPAENYVNQYCWDTPDVAKLKYLINFLLTPVQRHEVIDSLFSYLNGDEKNYSLELYLNSAQIKELGSRGYLGSHGHNHEPLSCLGLEDLILELKTSMELLNSYERFSVESFSYPYGGATAVNEMVVRMASECGYLSGMTMTRGFNDITQILNHPLSLKRFDANDIYGGKSPII